MVILLLLFNRPLRMLDLSSMTRDQICVPYTENTGSITTGLQGSPDLLLIPAPSTVPGP